MPIRIKCPSCQTILGVKESLAGKRANCPRCRFLLTIPMPKASALAPAVPTAEEAEALAASAFADEPAAAAKPESTQQIEFECPFCMEMIKVSADLAGKQTPCPNPECKRIIKVPLLKENKPKDWRQAERRGPSGAMQKNEEEPEGAWSTAQKTRVSMDSLIEADAVPVKKEPVTVRTWIRRGMLAVVALVVFIGAWWGISAWISNKRLYGTLNNALEASERAKPKPAQAADVLRGAGEFHVAVRQPSKAMEYFGKSRALLIHPPDQKPVVDLERDTVLTELVLAMVDLGGDEREVFDKYRLDWEEVQKELQRTLALLSCDESKQMALREVVRKLLTRDQAGVAKFLTNQLAAAPPEAAQPAVEDGDKKAKPPAPALSRLAVQQIALLLALGDGKTAKQILAPPNLKEPINDALVRLVYAEGRAREGKFSEAQVIAKAKPHGPDTALDRFEASLAVAAVALSDKKNDEARSNLQDALHILHKELKKEERTKKPALLLQLARIAARLDMPAEVKNVAVLMPDSATKTLVLVELITARIEAATAPVPATILDEMSLDKDTLAYGLALEKLARHNTRLGQRSDALALADDLDDRLKSFVYIGVALGMLDARK
jgi:hypothetical protein